MSRTPFELKGANSGCQFERATPGRLPGNPQDTTSHVDSGSYLRPGLSEVCQSLAPSTSLCVTRIVRGQPGAAESRTQ
jgi:hypothetical protein